MDAIAQGTRCLLSLSIHNGTPKPVQLDCTLVNCSCDSYVPNKEQIIIPKQGTIRFNGNTSHCLIYCSALFTISRLMAPTELVSQDPLLSDGNQLSKQFPDPKAVPYDEKLADWCKSYLQQHMILSWNIVYCIFYLR